MSIEDFITEEVKASGLNIRVTTHLDVDGYAKEVADEIDEQVFHAVAIRKGYVKERTTHIDNSDPDVNRCYLCGEPLYGFVKFCHECGARLVEP